jgi:hypothetical protein
MEGTPLTSATRSHGTRTNSNRGGSSEPTTVQVEGPVAPEQRREQDIEYDEDSCLRVPVELHYEFSQFTLDEINCIGQWPIRTGCGNFSKVVSTLVLWVSLSEQRESWMDGEVRYIRNVLQRFPRAKRVNVNLRCRSGDVDERVVKSITESVQGMKSVSAYGVFCRMWYKYGLEHCPPMVMGEKAVSDHGMAEWRTLCTDISKVDGCRIAMNPLMGDQDGKVYVDFNCKCDGKGTDCK